MKKLLLPILILLLAGSVNAQTGMIKMVSKKIEGPAEVAPGIAIKAGDVIELHEGRAPEGFRHVYMLMSTGPVPLGYGANYELLEVSEVRYNAKHNEYFVLVKYNTATYIVEVDKGLKSGEIKQVIPK
jgi:hypothetical protein